MDLELRNFFTLLNEHAEDDITGPKYCNQLLINLNEVLTQEQLSLSDLDLNLCYLFNKSYGFPSFIIKTVNKSQYKLSIKSILEIIYTLINNFPKKLEKFITTIYDICFKVIKSGLVSADETAKAFDVVLISFEKINKSLELPDCYTKLYNDLLKLVSNKKSSTVKEKLFQTLGNFAKHFQYLVPDAGRLKCILINSLEIEMCQKELSARTLSGLFSGLDYFCESFPFDPKSKDDMTIINKLYKYVDRLTLPEKKSIKTGNRAALTFLANNISLFIDLIVKKIEYWHERLLEWLDFGEDDQKIGCYIIEALYRELGTFLLDNISQSDKNVTTYLLKCFKASLLSRGFSRQKRLSLNGLSSFSGVYLVQLNDEEIKEIFSSIMQSFERNFVFNQEPSIEVLADLPCYLQTVAKFIHFRKISNSELFYLQKSTVMLIKIYPQLPYFCHNVTIEALVSTFYFLLINNEKLFENFIENVIYQGVIWSCSNQHISEAEMLEKNDNVITVRNYFNLWKGLLQILPQRKFDKLGITFHDRKYITIKIVDKLLKTLLVLINKLNVSIALKDTENAATDIQLAYKVVELNDFAIFLNLVDFYEEVFEKIDPNIIKKCASKLIHHLVSKCDSHPLISGFYKLLSFSLKVCDKIDYFDDLNSDFAQDVKMCNLTLTKFADNILRKTNQFKGDLLIACLQVVLSYPVIIIRSILPACVPSFKIIFDMGRTYIKLAHTALDTLEFWQKTISSEEMEPFLIQIIPLLDHYLQSKTLGNFSDSDLLQKKRKTARALKKRTVTVRFEPELLRLQMRIINFIGEQKSSLCQAFAFREEDLNLLVLSNQQHLKIILPYEDMKLELYLDRMLPRITNVALNSTDRKTRIMACEVLQAAIMVFLGTTKQLSRSGSSDLNELLRYIAVPILRLGCDTDQVVEQLFQPLCFQLIHWYTHSLQTRSEHSAIIIEAILESITHPTDTALRDFSGKCINEYVKWTIKQTNEKNLARDPINIKILIKKMRFYSTHPDSSKKLGAALIFNNIYRELREEISLLNIFWIEILHIFIKSLSTFEHELEEEVMITQINNALSHIERGFIEKCDLFNTVDRDRRVPVDMKTGNLTDVALWLLEQSGSLSYHCRLKSMEMFCKIVPFTQNYSSVQDFVAVNYNQEDCKKLYESFLIHYSTLEKMSECENKHPNKWLQELLRALDGNIFIMEQKLKESNALSDCLITAIQYFLAKISTATLDVAFSLIEAREWLFTSFERQMFDKQKSQTVLRIIKLINLCDSSQKLFHNCDLWCLVKNLIFNREVLGFNYLLPDKQTDKEVVFLLENFLLSLNKNEAVELSTIVETYIRETIISDIVLESNVSLIQRNLLKGLKLFQSLSLENFDFQKFSTGMVANLLNIFISKAESNIISLDNLQDTTSNYCSMILDYALVDKNEFQSFVEFLFKPYEVQTTNYKQPLFFGIYLLTLFEDSIMEKIINNFDYFLQQILQKQDVIQQGIELIFFILTRTSHQRKLKVVNELVVKTVLNNWDIFQKYFNGNDENVETGLNFVKCLIFIIKSSEIDCGILKKWLINLLYYDVTAKWVTDLDVKVEIFYLWVDLMDLSDDEDTDLRNGLVYLSSKIIDSSEDKSLLLDKLFIVTPNIKTPELLIFLLDLYVKINTENSNSDIKTLLRNHIINNNESEELILSKVYRLYSSENLDNDQKYKLAINTTTLFQYCKFSVFENFFVANISNIFKELNESTTSVNLVKKISNFMLLEILFLRCPVKSDDTEISPITSAALPENPNNKAFLNTLLKIGFQAIKDRVDDNSDYLRLYKCHSFNAMISIISNSMKNINFYTKLFIREENNVDILWANIVDTNKQYIFQTDFETIPQRRKFLLNIRNELRVYRKSKSSYASVKYVESQRVFNSSLSEDLTKFDFSNNILRSQVEEGDDEIHIQSEIELDCIDVNNHECMVNVCGLIEHMVSARIIDLPTEADEDYELPAWVVGIRALLLNPETHINVKIFFIKVFNNTVHIFKHFAKWFLEPLLKFIVDRCAGNSMNYFITDVVAILASWSGEILPTTEKETRLASDLLIFLINNLNNERQDIFKYHLELIRVLVEAWKSSITLPYEVLFTKLSGDSGSRKLEVGIHLFSVFLSNKIFPWEDKITEFCKTMFNVIMISSLKSTYKPAAETVGLLLQYISRNPGDSKIFRNVHVLLKKINNPEKYANVLESIVLHYPQIADEDHLKLLLSRIHSVQKPLKLIYLRIILTRSDIVSNINDFKTERWESYIESDDMEVQLLTLEVVYKYLDVLRVSASFNSIIGAVCGHVSNSNVLCRTRMFDIVISTYQGDYSKEITDLCRPVLVQGLIDTDLEIREKVYEFWRNNYLLPTQISARFSYVLSNLYETTTESDFLGYGSYLLLDIIKRTEQYNDLLFEHPLEDCDFENYNLQTNWRYRNLSIVPLFAETVRSQNYDFGSTDFDDINKLRQTQTTKEFSVTQSVRTKQFSQFTVPESSLFIKSDDDKVFVNPNLVNLSHKYRVPQRRFLKNKSQIRNYFAQQEVRKSVQRIEQQKDKVKEREHKVTIYRSYRKGDLPDIQITLQAVLEPLQALTLHDGEISKILYSEIFKNILIKMGNDVNFLEQISSPIKVIFMESTQFNRSLFRTLFDALFQCKKSLNFPADLIVKVCHSSGLRALGALLLEEYLISYDTSSTDAKKSRGIQASSEIDLWVKLAGLYKEMDEWDVVKSIFLQKTESSETIKDALSAESSKLWKDAQDIYKKLIENDDCLERKDFYYESYFKCFAYLGEWDKLVESIDSIVNHSGGSCWNNLWDNGFNQYKLMPWYISGQLKKCLFSADPNNQFFSDLNASLNSDNLQFIENNFCEELAMLWIFKEETDEAEKYSKMFINKFLNHWQQTDMFYANLRYNSLLKLRNMIDINKFLQVFVGISGDCSAQLYELIKYYNRTSHENLPSILYSEERVLYRRQFLNLILKKLSNGEVEELISELNQVKFNLNDGLIDLAIEQSNFYMTRKHLSVDNNQNMLKTKVTLSRLSKLKADLLKNSEQKMEVLLKGCEALDQIFEQPCQSSLKVQAYIHFFKQLEYISSIFRGENQLFLDKKPLLESFIKDSTISSEEQIELYGANKLKSFLFSFENDLENEMVSEKLAVPNYQILADAYIQLAYFAKRKGRSHFSDFMLFVLRAMKFNSSEGKQLFPCIIMEEAFTEDETKQFIEEVEKIPIWMFLGWIPQILANIDSPKVGAFTHLILKIAKTYPQAIMYAYRLSKENYKCDSEESRDLIKKLDDILLSDNRVDKFLKALSFVGIPASILFYYVRKMEKCCFFNNLEQVKNIINNLEMEVFNCKPDSRDVSAMQGNMFKKISNYQKDFKNIEKLITKKSKFADIAKLIKKIDDDLTVFLRNDSESKRHSHLLKDYCPWLANFSTKNVNLDLEIPGQYDGKQMPLTQHHVRISGFCPNVLVMSSLRKPIKVTIIGNNTKEYPFLIKFGEDVRQDQRIEQLFTLMNDIFKNDKSLNGRNFSLLTYQVIPLTTNLGIIQWIDNTMSLDGFVKSSFKDPKSARTYDQICGTYRKFIFKSANQNIADAYGFAAKNYSRDKVIPKFRQLVSCLEWDVFRTRFFELSTNIESFYALRNNFIQSYAVMCISHWILGVGDRHLSNSLICLKNGKVLGIDFGHAFGTATMVLPIPELVPFRLTPHLVNLMEPLGEKGLCREIMVHCLRSLRSNSGSLLSTMNVFIKEPSLDWLEHSSKYEDKISQSLWYPKEKISQAERKLRGAKSTTIMIEDLRIGQQKNQDYMKAYIKLVEGTPQFDFRSRVNGDELSVEDQVDCLIDHATDYNLLGRMYEGWTPWV